MQTSIELQKPVVQYVVNADDLRSMFKDLMKEFVEKQEEESRSEEYLSLEEVLKILKVSRQTLWRWNKENYLKPVKIGSKVRYKKSEILKAIEG